MTVLSLPSYFRLQDLTLVTGSIFELKRNPHQSEANFAAEAWFKSIGAYPTKKLNRFLSHRFDDFAGLSFPDADQAHLETCIKFFYWAFSFDDLSDEGELQCKPEQHQIGVNLCLRVFEGSVPDAHDFPYARMLQEIWNHLNITATPGTRARFTRAAQNWCKGQIQQSTNRATDRIPSVEEFILMRRYTIGGAMVEAMVEYSLDIDLPDFVFEDPIIIAMSDATNDIMTWPNDICSFNKEQADGDMQNLVYCVMVERNVDLQTAIDFVTDMLSARVREYVSLKERLPSFGPRIDRELGRYIKALEHFVQGTVVWYYSARYFRDIDISNRQDLMIHLFERSTECEISSA